MNLYTPDSLPIRATKALYDVRLERVDGPNGPEKLVAMVLDRALLEKGLHVDLAFEEIRWYVGLLHGMGYVCHHPVHARINGERIEMDVPFDGLEDGDRLRVFVHGSVDEVKPVLLTPEHSLVYGDAAGDLL